MEGKKSKTWKALITLDVPSTIEVSVEACSIVEAIDLINENIKDGLYDLEMTEAVYKNAEYEDWKIHEVKEA